MWYCFFQNLVRKYRFMPLTQIELRFCCSRYVLFNKTFFSFREAVNWCFSFSILTPCHHELILKLSRFKTANLLAWIWIIIVFLFSQFARRSHYLISLLNYHAVFVVYSGHPHKMFHFPSPSLSWRWVGRSGKNKKTKKNEHMIAY